MQTFTAGTTPAEVIKAALIADVEVQDNMYPMTLVGEEAEIVENLVNVGIDAHLEACNMPSRYDSFKWVGSRLKCSVSIESMLVLLRRMTEGHIYLDGETEEDAAMLLRSGILQTIDIEEV